MKADRTGSMTVVGILNIVLGAIGALASGLVVLGGGLLAVGGAAMEAEFGADAEGLRAAAATGGGIMVVIGLVALIVWALLLVAGFGVLKMRSWGRTLSMGCGGLIVLLSLFLMLEGGVGLVNLGTLIYGGLLVGLFLQPAWREAFCGIGSPVIRMAGSGEHQKAA